jgi:hypothetical protein
MGVEAVATHIIMTPISYSLDRIKAEKSQKGIFIFRPVFKKNL